MHNNNTNDNNEGSNMFNNDPFYSFDSFVDPSMLLPEDVNFESLSASDLAMLDTIPALPSEIPSVGGNDKGGPGSLYDKLTTTPTSSSNPMVMMSSPAMYPYGSPYSMASPSSLMMSASNATDASWMHSSRPRRRRSSYATSPTMGSSMMNNNNSFMPSYPGMSPMMQQASPQMMYHHQHYPQQYHQHHPGYPTTFMMAPPMSPMNVTVKLPMVPLTPTNMASGSSAATTKIPLVLPCHLNSSGMDSKNTAAPNVSRLSTSTTEISSGVPSRCSSIAPNSSISNAGSTSNTSNASATWFTEMSATKDRFLQDVDRLDFTNVTVLELKQILRKFGLNSTGKKAQLVERISEISTYLQAEGRKRAKIDRSSATVESNSAVVV